MKLISSITTTSYKVKLDSGQILYFKVDIFNEPKGEWEVDEESIMLIEPDRYTEIELDEEEVEDMVTLIEEFITNLNK